MKTTPLFTRVERLSFVVHDAEALCQEYANAFGIGPWQISEDRSIRIDGEENRIRSAMCGKMQYELEIIQPLQKDGFLASRLAEKGPGLVWLYLTPAQSPEETGAQLRHSEIPVVPLYDGNERYLADVRKDLGFFIAYAEQGSLAPQAVRAQISVPADPEIHITQFGQLGIVTGDLYETMDFFWKKLGMAPWRRLVFDETLLENAQYKGRPTVYSLEIGQYNIGDVEIELLWPLKGMSTFEEYRQEIGNGLHHVNFKYDEPYDQVLACFDAHDVGPIQTAYVGGFEYCVFSDHSRKLGLYLELGHWYNPIPGPAPYKPLYPEEPA